MTDQAARPRLTTTQWLICTMAAIGFAFDIYELLMLPLVAKDALLELGGIRPGTPEFRFWFSLMFYVPAVFGGIFGLFGGYLTDRFGRRSVLTWSILLYAFSAFAAGFSTSLPMLLTFRTLVFIGVCVEFVAAVAWLAELFDDPHQREQVLGYTQAFSSVGGLLVAVAHGIMISLNKAQLLPEVQIPAFLGLGQISEAGMTAPWRFTLMSGLIPALPLLVIRPFLPESPKWAQKRASNSLRRPSVAQLFAPELRQTTIITTLMFMCSFGIAFGAIQQLQQIVPGIDAVKVEADAAAEAVLANDKIPADRREAAARAARGQVESEKNADYTKSQELGGMFGRFALAMLTVIIVSRRGLLRLFVVPSLVLMPFIFYTFAQGKETTFFSVDISFIPGFHHFSISVLGVMIFLAGFLTVAQFSFWGNYLPRVYPLHLRGTGESFAANIGGRMLGTSFTAVTQFLVSPYMPGNSAPEKVAYGAAVVAGGLCALSLILSCFLPEPPAEMED
jgi:MFS family permease